MSDADALLIRIAAEPDAADSIDTASTREWRELNRRLLVFVAAQAVESADAVESELDPDEPKGVSAVFTWIAVKVSAIRLSTLVEALKSWAARTDQRLEIRYGDDAIILRPTADQQERLVEQWLERNASRPDRSA